MKQVDLVPRRRNRVGLGAVVGANEGDLSAFSSKRVGYGQRRNDVPRRSARRHHDS